MKHLTPSSLTDATITSLTANYVVVTDANKKLISSTATNVEVGYLSGVTSLIQTQINSKQSLSEKGIANGYAPLDANKYLPAANSGALTGHVTSPAGSSVTTIASGVIVDSHISNTASISWSKVNSAGLIADFDISTSATIGWTKISKAGSSLADLITRSAGDLSSGTLLAARMPALTGDITMTAGTTATAIATGVIVNADINSGAAIDASKIANGTVSNAEFQFLDGVTSSIQTQLNAKSGGLYVGTAAPTDTTLLWQQI